MFAGSAQILTKQLVLDGTPYQIIGVMPAEFRYPHNSDFPPGVLGGNANGADVWVPLALSAQQKADRQSATANVIARLNPGVTVRQAQAEMTTLMAGINLLHAAGDRGWGAYVKPFLDSAIGPVRNLMWLLVGAVFLVLLIACGNAANLLLARAAARTHELGVRATLGAAKGRIIRQLLTESLLLALAGGVAGVAAAKSGRHPSIDRSIHRCSSPLLHFDHRCADQRGVWHTACVLRGPYQPGRIFEKWPGNDWQRESPARRSGDRGDRPGRDPAGGRRAVGAQLPQRRGGAAWVLFLHCFDERAT